MSTKAHERSVYTEATFTVTNHAGEQVEVRRELMIWETNDAEWRIAVTEPDEGGIEGEALAGDLLAVPDAAAGVFDDLFTRIAAPSRLGATTR